MHERRLTALALARPLPWRNKLRLLKNIFIFKAKISLGMSPVLVYQMGKVGSSALVTAVNKTPGYFSVQAHRLMPDRRAEMSDRFDRGEHYVRDMRFERWLYHTIKNSDMHIRIVCATREPMSHSFSAFFQNLKRSTHGTIRSATSSDLEDLRKAFLCWDELGAALNWFDQEASQLVGIDLLSIPFDKNKGWSLVDHGRFSLLILKSELDNARKREAIGTLLRCTPEPLLRVNDASDKMYAESYRRFRETVKLPKWQAARFAEHRYTRHFYTESEIVSALSRFSEQETN